MRLLICTQAIDRNDPALGFFHRWIEEFAKHCESIVVVCLRKGDFALPKNVEVIALGERHRALRALELCAIALGRRAEYNAVFVHMNPEYLVAAGWLWRLLGKRTALWYVHRAVTQRLRIAVAFSDAVLTVSEKTFRLPSQKVVTLGHGVNVAEGVVDRSRHEVLVISALGRISKVKRFDDMLPALSALYAMGTSFEFRIVGSTVTAEDVEYERDLRAKISRLPWRDCVVFTGRVPHADISKVLTETDVVLSMTPEGSYDKSVLEALNWGALVVTSNTALAGAPGVQIVDPSDPEAVARAIMNAPAPLEETRAYLRTHHDLRQLVVRIVEILAQKK